jgi:hypothetical protein
MLKLGMITRYILNEYNMSKVKMHIKNTCREIILKIEPYISLVPILPCSQPHNIILTF